MIDLVRQQQLDLCEVSLYFLLLLLIVLFLVSFFTRGEVVE